MTSLRARLSAWGKLGALLLFPSSCEICRALLVRPGEKVVCRNCLDGLRMTDSPFCLCCGRFFNGSGESHLCAVCLERRPSFVRHRSVARYEGVVKDIILIYKYRGFEVLSRCLGDFIIRNLGREEDLWSGLEAIIPVPLHPAKERSRGFNQARLLARRLSQLTNVPLVNRCLVKVRPTPAQTSLKACDRETNLRGTFRVRKPAGLAGKVVLLVDDVCTTGSTLRECSKALRQAGVKEVRAVTIAHA
ncbi:MAG: ComF family protein [Candidatus Aminicenantales bacterium]